MGIPVEFQLIGEDASNGRAQRLNLLESSEVGYNTVDFEHAAALRV